MSEVGGFCRNRGRGSREAAFDESRFGPGAIAIATMRSERKSIVCARCGQELEDRDEAEGCEDLQCPLI